MSPQTWDADRPFGEMDKRYSLPVGLEEQRQYYKGLMNSRDILDDIPKRRRTIFYEWVCRIRNRLLANGKKI